MRKASKPTRYPGVHDLGDGTYRLRGRARHSKTGAPLDLDTAVKAKNPRAASLMRAKLLEELESRDTAPQAKGRVRLGEYAESWIASKLPRLKPSTRELYALLLDTAILPSLGAFFVDAITIEDLVRWRDEQANTLTKYGKAPSAVSVNGRIRLLKSLMRDAVHDLKLDRDPTLRLEPLREGRKRRNSLTADELRRLLEAAARHAPAWHFFFYTLAFSGLRLGELTALRFRDVDESRMCICIEAAQWKGHEGTTKTDEPRTWPIFPEWLELLRKHRARLLDERKARAKRERVSGIDALTITDDELIFAGPKSGAHMHNTAPRKALAVCLEAAGIDRRFTVHGFRHTFNNLARQLTRDGVLIRSLTGHADEAMTERYSHVDLAEKRAAVIGLTQLVRGNAEP